ncbi:MAG: hypothetical protein ABSG37_12845 [Candidatus Limnocylindrales bacterium]|jgi:hypothetical protein
MNEPLIGMVEAVGSRIQGIVTATTPHVSERCARCNEPRADPIHHVPDEADERWG